MLNVAVLATATSVLADVHYVDVTSTNATPPYTNWTTAATNIQDAMDAAVAGDEIVVTNGTYSNVTVGKPLSVRSINGPQFTTINGSGQYGCAHLANGASLTGFTLTNGSAYYNFPHGGGGVFCESVTAVVSNCVITGNRAINFDGTEGFGGGAYGGTLNNCTLSNNSVFVRSYAAGLLLAHGGGAYGSTLNNCTLTGNGVFFGRIITGTGSPLSTAYGGGAYGCTLNNCTLTGNRAIAFPGDLNGGGGAYGSTLNNCIVYDNSPDDAYYHNGLNHCWTTDPLFVDTNGWVNLRLQSNSPCINAGNNSYVTNATDLDNNPRISGGTVDIGAYEYQWPQLTIARSGPNVLLTWPTNNAGYDYTGFTLQSTTNLNSPIVWNTNSPAPIVIGAQNVVTNPITGPQQFFRLSQ